MLGKSGSPGIGFGGSCPFEQATVRIQHAIAGAKHCVGGKKTHRRERGYLEIRAGK